MNLQGLIERYEKFKASKKELTSIDLVLKDLRSLDEPEPLPFKLKDVVRRIRGFDPTTQTRWLNDILKELGNDYGLMKYREGYEQGKFEGAWVGEQLKDADKIRQELNIPVIPQFVADWYENNKDYLEYNFQDWIKHLSDYRLSKNEQFGKWVNEPENNPAETLIKMKLFGYEVEEEKRYLIKVKNTLTRYGTLNRSKKSKDFIFSNPEENSLFDTKFTRKELEEANFGWVFDCPGIEIEEVEG